MREDGKTNGYIVLKRKVTLDTWEAIKKTMSTLTFGVDESKLKAVDKRFYTNLRAKSVFAEDDEIRVYPNGRLASHVLGYVGNDDLQSGQNGIELAFNSKLTGVRGWLRTEIDKRQRELVVFREEAVDPRDGLNVVLTHRRRPAKHRRKRAGRNHEKAHADQRVVHHGSSAHRRNSRDGDFAEL